MKAIKNVDFSHFEAKSLPTERNIFNQSEVQFHTTFGLRSMLITLAILNRAKCFERYCGLVKFIYFN